MDDRASNNCFSLSPDISLFFSAGTETGGTRSSARLAML